MGPRNLQTVAEERSLEMHREVARLLRTRPELLEAARARVQGWLQDGSVSRFYASAWAELLVRPLDELISALLDAGENARALRQTSPFAGALDARTRWRIHREVGRRLGVLP
jgi:hypothetical protein